MESTQLFAAEKSDKSAVEPITPALLGADPVQQPLQAVEDAKLRHPFSAYLICLAHEADAELYR